MKKSERLFGAWLAGLVDGEGSFMLERFQLRSGRISYKPVVTVTNTNLDALRLIRSRLGYGAVYVYPRTGFGGCRWKPLGRFQVGSRKDLFAFLATISPHLVIKAGQARELLAFLLLPTRERGCRARPLSADEIAKRDKTVVTIRALNRRGPV